MLHAFITRSMAATSLLVVSSLVQAGSGSATVVVGPLAAAPVPTLSGYLLIVLGLLLAVIAFRTLRNNQGAQKLIGILVLGGGLIVSGIGVDRALAISAQPVIKSVNGGLCNTDGPIVYNPFNGTDTILENDCTISIEIKSFAPSCSSSNDFFDTVNAGCKQGQVLTAGASCSFLPKCNTPG